MEYDLVTSCYILLIVIIVGIVSTPSLIAETQTKNIPASDFTATDENGVKFSLHDYSGKVVILHFTGVENSLCIECLEEMEGQIHELEKLVTSSDNVSIITISIQKTLLPRVDTKWRLTILGEYFMALGGGFQSISHSRIVSKILDC